MLTDTTFQAGRLIGVQEASMRRACVDETALPTYEPRRIAPPAR